MDKVKVSAEEQAQPNLQKLARALISIARRQNMSVEMSRGVRKPGDAA